MLFLLENEKGHYLLRVDTVACTIFSHTTLIVSLKRNREPYGVLRGWLERLSAIR